MPILAWLQKRGIIPVGGISTGRQRTNNGAGAFGAFHIDFRRHLESIVRFAGGSFEIFTAFLASLVLEGFVVDASIDDMPWEASVPQALLAKSDAVAQVIPGIEHESVPYHQYV